jgi:putative transposase
VNRPKFTEREALEEEFQGLRDSRWECKYHLVWIPKCRKKVLYGQLRQYLGEVLRELARQRESLVSDGRLMGDQVHMFISISPKYQYFRQWDISKARVQFMWLVHLVVVKEM